MQNPDFVTFSIRPDWYLNCIHISFHSVYKKAQSSSLELYMPEAFPCCHLIFLVSLCSIAVMTNRLWVQIKGYAPRSVRIDDTIEILDDVIANFCGADSDKYIVSLRVLH